MFKKTLGELEKLSHRVEMSVSIPLDEYGFMARRCPGEPCGELFKVHADDWTEKVRDEAVFCPICRHEADAKQWNTAEQDAHIESTAYVYLSRALDDALRADTRAFNASSPKNSFVRMSMTLKSGPHPVVLPLSAAEVMELRTSCEACGCRYASIGAAFFCPACGHNSACTTFASVLTTVRSTLDSLATLTAALTDSVGRDVARDAERSVLEQSLQRLVASFQRFAEATFSSLRNADELTIKKNVFQRLKDASELWKA
jgi:uncharacterized Zn finger protein (UPF0148 family)